MKRYIKVAANQEVKAAKSSPALHTYFDGLDDRFTFDLDDEFEIYVGNDLVTCYTTDSSVFGDGEGLTYTVVTPIAGPDYIGLSDRIQRGLDEYFHDQTDGSDYTYGLGATEKTSGYQGGFPNVDVDHYYVTLVDVYPVDGGSDETID